MNKLKEKNIKIHAFYVHNDAKDNFEEIARETGGKHDFLDVKDQVKGATFLTDFVTREILRLVNPEFADMYENKYMRAYLKIKDIKSS